MNQLRLFVSIVEAIYLIYMFCWFQTRWTVHSPWESTFTKTLFQSNWLKHSVSRDIYENKICSMGHQVALLISGWLILRNFLKNSLILLINWIIIGSLLVGSFVLNWNALIYSLPVLVVELILYFCN